MRIVWTLSFVFLLGAMGSYAQSDTFNKFLKGFPKKKLPFTTKSDLQTQYKAMDSLSSTLVPDHTSTVKYKRKEVPYYNYRYVAQLPVSDSFYTVVYMKRSNFFSAYKNYSYVLVTYNLQGELINNVDLASKLETTDGYILIEGTILPSHKIECRYYEVRHYKHNESKVITEGLITYTIEADGVIQ